MTTHSTITSMALVHRDERTGHAWWRIGTQDGNTWHVSVAGCSPTPEIGCDLADWADRHLQYGVLYGDDGRAVMCVTAPPDADLAAQLPDGMVYHRTAAGRLALVGQVRTAA